MLVSSNCVMGVMVSGAAAVRAGRGTVPLIIRVGLKMQRYEPERARKGSM